MTRPTRFHQRRRLLQGALGTATLAALPPVGAGRKSILPPLPDDTILRTIPATGEQVPISGMGTARTFDVDPNDVAAMVQRQDVLRAFVDNGGRVVDSSPMYGRAETVLGRAAAAIDAPDALFTATKVWTRGVEAGKAQMRESAERLQTATIDLMQVHNLLDLETHLDTLRAWKKEGRIRYLGVTHYTVAQHATLAELVAREPLDFVQFNYNIAERNAEIRLLEACADNGVAVLVNEPFERGKLFARVRNKPLPGVGEDLACESWAQLFLKYIFGHPAVTVAIPATSDREHAAENARAGRGALPDEAQRKAMRTAFEAAG
ncbi:aldo/keto reductase [Spectribacter hydrogenoxidans]|uniref:Aldo/keto reductase n=1 Tax=Spectribacter hydrogenoxidans TaxID=3075608 RepID=A0ABU3C1W5_9GAMM|nr:aldo/keto reductase [Salinisphaera sp. W335]MDT0635550.1 aldo/keto reductase [Salinisphaera sp. W335]